MGGPVAVCGPTKEIFVAEIVTKPHWKCDQATSDQNTTIVQRIHLQTLLLTGSLLTMKVCGLAANDERQMAKNWEKWANNLFVKWVKKRQIICPLWALRLSLVGDFKESKVFWTKLRQIMGPLLEDQGDTIFCESSYLSTLTPSNIFYVLYKQIMSRLVMNDPKSLKAVFGHATTW